MRSASSPFVSDPSLFRALERESRPVPCDNVRTLFRRGERCKGLFILQRGEAILELRLKGGENVVRIQTPAGSLLGLPAVLENQPYSLSAIVSQGARVRSITQSDCLKLLQSDPALAFRALQMMAAETRATRSEIVSFMTQKSAKTNKRISKTRD